MKPLHEVNENQTIEEQCKTVLENWKIVVEENESQLAYVSEYTRQTWRDMQQDTEDMLSSLSEYPLSVIHEKLMGLQDKILGATRKDMEKEHLEKIRIEQERKEAELAAKRKEEKERGGILQAISNWKNRRGGVREIEG